MFCCRFFNLSSKVVISGKSVLFLQIELGACTKLIDRTEERSKVVILNSVTSVLQTRTLKGRGFYSKTIYGLLTYPIDCVLPAGKMLFKLVVVLRICVQGF